MRKDYYSQSSRGGKWLMRSNFLYFFLAWNAFGICVYQWYSGKSNKDPAWQQMSMSQKYLALMSKPEDEITVVDIKGISQIQSRNITVEELIAPPKKE